MGWRYSRLFDDPMTVLRSFANRLSMGGRVIIIPACWTCVPSFWGFPQCPSAFFLYLANSYLYFEAQLGCSLLWLSNAEHQGHFPLFLQHFFFIYFTKSSSHCSHRQFICLFASPMGTDRCLLNLRKWVKRDLWLPVLGHLLWKYLHRHWWREEKGRAELLLPLHF